MAAPRRFFSRPLPGFQNVAMLVLCIVFFLLPFALRGARMAVTEMQNNVADWLPSDYEETIDLGEFRKYFIGDQFVVVSGPWCKEGNPAYTNLKRKIFEESVEYERILREQDETEIIRAHRKGDELGLMVAGTYHEEWGQYSERWLKGSNQQWYWINRDGELYRWEGQNNVLEGAKRFFERLVDGRNQALGTLVGQFGRLPDDQTGTPNPFYNNPELLCARPFKSVTTGPEALEQMAGPNGTLRTGKVSESGDVEFDEASAFEARIEAHKRLSGALFGPTPVKTFQWTFDSLLQHVDDKNLLQQLLSVPSFRSKFDEFMKQELDARFDGDRDRLTQASENEQLDLWLRMWDAIGLDAPPRQTCLIVTINDPFLEELDRIVGRPLFGKPRGRILELATGKCGLDQSSIHMGGPPSDNVAIDEEGTSTLLRLASLSGLIGIILAYYSFRSIRITIMLFFIGGVSAISSLSYVWYFGSRLDAILMTMPSLIYVLSMSGAVHIVNYYKDACEEYGHKRAVDIAIHHGWFPCVLAAFTTALGLFSLCTSNLTPIYKFGFFSAIATIATLFFLFTYLPAALTVWPPPYRRIDKSDATHDADANSAVLRFWNRVFAITTYKPTLVLVVGLLLMVVFSYGLTKIQTTVQLLKLFDPDAKVLKDYEWMEENLGKLVPAEIVINVDERVQQEVKNTARLPNKSSDEELLAAGGTATATPDRDQASETTPPAISQTDTPADGTSFDADKALKYTLLERMEISYRIRRQLERFFGPDGSDIVGAGMSTDVFVPIQIVDTQLDTNSNIGIRRIFNTRLLQQRDAMADQDYLAISDAKTLHPDADTIYSNSPHYDKREMWRISLRLGALKNVDYGKFVNDLKMVVEPIMTAYQYRTQILSKIFHSESYTTANGSRPKKELIILLGRDPKPSDGSSPILAAQDNTNQSKVFIDQTYLFSMTLDDLLENRGFDRMLWIDPHKYGPDNPFPEDSAWAKLLKTASCVVMVEDSPLFNKDFIEQNANLAIDCRKHKFAMPGQETEFASAMTAMNRSAAGQDLAVTATYTGIVPIVYKAQGALLRSLIESIVLSFVMISLVMMILLRNWRAPLSPTNSLNVAGGMLSMVPNIFPLVMIFGAMGYLKIKVDIGSMMTASVAMGIAVDDTIHFLNWYRNGLAEGLSRQLSIKRAYSRCASAMTQTTLIAGCGLSVFALSTFQPTQRFGVLMLVLLAAALVGDLIILPALLASPLGRFFGKTNPNPQKEFDDEDTEGEVNLRVVSPAGDATLNNALEKTLPPPSSTPPHHKRKF